MELKRSEKRKGIDKREVERGGSGLKYDTTSEVMNESEQKEVEW